MKVKVKKNPTFIVKLNGEEAAWLAQTIMSFSWAESSDGDEKLNVFWADLHEALDPDDKCQYPSPIKLVV